MSSVNNVGIRIHNDSDAPFEDPLVTVTYRKGLDFTVYAYALVADETRHVASFDAGDKKTAEVHAAADGTKASTSVALHDRLLITVTLDRVADASGEEQTTIDFSFGKQDFSALSAGARPDSPASPRART